MWINNTLNNINNKLQNAEKQKQENKQIKQEEISNELILNPKRFKSLLDSDIWNFSLEEKKSLSEFQNRMITYHTINYVQKRIFEFAKLKSVCLTFEENKKKDLYKYIDASEYWHKKSVETRLKSNSIKTVYAENKDMKSIIFKYLNTYIITSNSSFENYLRTLEGKEIIKND